MDETTPIKEALAPGTFDVLAFVEKAAYPTKLVTVFRDVGVAKKYTDLVAERSALETKLIDEKKNTVKDRDVLDLTERIDALGTELKKSSMTFELRGYAPGVVAEIQAKYTNDEDPEGTKGDPELIAHAIIGVLDADGNRDDRVWDAEGVLTLKKYLVEGEYVKLLSGVAEVIFNAAVFDKATDAGFSS